jgi:hypothetical protein
MTSLTQLSRLLTQFDKLDLGYTYDDSYGCLASPCGADSKTPKVMYPKLYVNRVKDDVMSVAETGTALVEYKITGRNMNSQDGKTKYGMDVEIRSFDPQAGAKAKAKESKPGTAKAVMLERLDGALTEMARGDRYAAAKVEDYVKKHPAGAVQAGLAGLKAGEQQAKGDVARASAGKFKNPDSIKLKAKWLRMNRGVMKFSEFSDRTRDNDGQFVGAATGGADPVTMRQAYGTKGKKSLVAGAGAAALAGAGMLGGTQGGRKLVSKGLKVAGGGLHKLRAALVSKNSGGRGKGFMTQKAEKPGLGQYMQRRRMQGE